MSTAHEPHDGTDRTSRSRIVPAATAAGYLALVVAVLAAHRAPATGYEVSIYAATPVAFWAGVGVAFTAALAVSFGAVGERLRALAIALGGLTTLAVVALPVLRGYAYFGTGDSLSHLGWARQALGGEMGLLDLLYPGIHGIGLAVHAATGLPLRSALLFTVLSFIALFIAAVPVVTALITDDSTAVAIAAFSSFMLLPINGISAHMTAHPSTMAVLYFPFVLAVLVVYLRSVDGALTAIGAALSLSTVAITFVHPQQAGNLLLVMAAVVALGVVRRWGDAVVQRRSLVGQTAFLGAFLVGWSVLHERITAAAGSLVELAVLGASRSSTIAQRSGSLSDIGASLLELYLKLFLVSTVYLVLAGLLVVAVLVGDLRDGGFDRTTTWLSVGLLPVGALFGIYLVINYGTMYFRQLGFVMVVVTVLASLSLAGVTRGIRGVTDGLGTGVGRTVVGLAVAAMLVLSLATLFPSPYVYQPNMHVTDSHFEGYEATFATENEDVPMLGIRQGPDRFRDAVTGTGDLDSDAYRSGLAVPGPVLAAGNLTEHYEGHRYVAVTSLDRGRELAAFRGLRYQRGSLTNVGAEPGVHRVRTNGALELYVVDE